MLLGATGCRRPTGVTLVYPWEGTYSISGEIMPGVRISLADFNVSGGVFSFRDAALGDQIGAFLHYNMLTEVFTIWSDEHRQDEIGWLIDEGFLNTTTPTDQQLQNAMRARSIHWTTIFFFQEGFIPSMSPTQTQFINGFRQNHRMYRDMGLQA